MTLNDIKFLFWISAVMALIVACLNGYAMFGPGEHPEFKPGTHEKSAPTYDSKGQLEWTAPGWKNGITGYDHDGNPMYAGDDPLMWIGLFFLNCILPILAIPFGMAWILGFTNLTGKLGNFIFK